MQLMKDTSISLSPGIAAVKEVNLIDISNLEIISFNPIESQPIFHINVRNFLEGFPRENRLKYNKNLACHCSNVSSNAHPSYQDHITSSSIRNQPSFTTFDALQVVCQICSLQGHCTMECSI